MKTSILSTIVRLGSVARVLVPVATATLVAAAGAGGCSSNDSARVDQVRTALAKTQVSLGGSIAVVETKPGTPCVPTRAAVITDVEPRFSVHANADGSNQEIQLDRAGTILSANAVGAPAKACSGATSLKAATEIAEQASGGKAFQIQPDDDDACLYEVQTLAGSTIWEVKIDRNGAVLEKEDATNDSNSD